MLLFLVHFAWMSCRNSHDGANSASGECHATSVCVRSDHCCHVFMCPCAGLWIQIPLHSRRHFDHLCLNRSGLENPTFLLWHQFDTDCYHSHVHESRELCSDGRDSSNSTTSSMGNPSNSKYNTLTHIFKRNETHYPQKDRGTPYEKEN